MNRDFILNALTEELERERAAHAETIRMLDAANETIIAMQRDVVDDAIYPATDCTGSEFIADMMGRVL